MPRRDCRAECSCCHSASQECQAMEAYEQRGHRPEPSRGGVKIPGPHPVAAMEWLSPPKPRRDQDALCETTGPEPHGAGLRPAGRGDPHPHRRAKPLHSSWHPCHRARRISPSGERGRTLFTRFVQLSPSEAVSKPSGDQTRLIATHVASSYHCKLTSSWSCTS